MGKDFENFELEDDVNREQGGSLFGLALTSS